MDRDGPRIEFVVDQPANAVDTPSGDDRLDAGPRRSLSRRSRTMLIALGAAAVALAAVDTVLSGHSSAHRASSSTAQAAPHGGAQILTATQTCPSVCLVHTTLPAAVSAALARDVPGATVVSALDYVDQQSGKLRARIIQLHSPGYGEISISISIGVLTTPSGGADNGFAGGDSATAGPGTPNSTMTWAGTGSAGYASALRISAVQAGYLVTAATTGYAPASEWALQAALLKVANDLAFIAAG